MSIADHFYVKNTGADEERQDDELRIRYQRTADEKGCQWSHDGVLL